jgi:hypothetical protein
MMALRVRRVLRREPQVAEYGVLRQQSNRAWIVTVAFASMGLATTGCSHSGDRASGDSSAKIFQGGAMGVDVTGVDPVVTSDVAAVLWRDGFQFVRIETGTDGGQKGAEPPQALSIDAVRAALSTVQLTDGGDPRPAFEPDQLALIVAPVCLALAQVKPKQDVGFAVGHTGFSFSAFGQNTLTAGRIFYDHGALNIIFGMVRAPYKGIMQGAEMPPIIRTGSRQAKQEVDYAVIANGPVATVSADRQDWARIAPSAWESIAVPPPTQINPAAAVPSSTAGPTDIETKLQTLRRLLDQNLITEKDYERRKTEILNQL